MPSPQGIFPNQISNPCLSPALVGGFFFVLFCFFLPLAAWEACKNGYVDLKKKRHDVRIANSVLFGAE